MKGSTHLAIGVVIGTAASAFYPFSVKQSAVYIAVAALSALSADLDGTSMLSSKLGKASRMLKNIIILLGTALALVCGYLYRVEDLIFTELAVVSAALIFLGFAVKEGIIRNTLVSLIGAAFLVGGWMWQLYGVIGFGLFVAWAPWLKHRGLTHTVWALVLWGLISWALEQELHINGLAAVSTFGYLSHLVADTLTPSGVKWLWPMYKKAFKLR